MGVGGKGLSIRGSGLIEYLYRRDTPEVCYRLFL